MTSSGAGLSAKAWFSTLPGLRYRKGSAVIGLGNELHPALDRHHQAVGFHGDAEGSRGRRADAAIAMDAVALALAFVGFGGRERPLASEPASAGRHAPKESKPGFCPFTHIFRWASALKERTERLGRVGIEWLDQNRGPHHELSRMRGEMGHVVDALVAAGRRRFRRSDVRGMAASGNCQHEREIFSSKARRDALSLRRRNDTASRLGRRSCGRGSTAQIFGS